jgi:hypothetical protein
MTAPARLRVAQWATGTIGSRSLRAVIEHPHLDLVGVLVHGADKAGRDAGELAGTAPTGVRATRDPAEILALAPDCVLHMPAGFDADEVCTLLAAGIDVVTTVGEFHHPASMDPDLRARVEAACRRGDSSIHATGSSPGFVTEALPLVLTSLSRRLDRLAIREFADLSRRPSPGLLFDRMGFGRPPGEVDAARLAHGERSFGPTLRALAESLGLPVDEVRATGGFGTATRDVEIAAGVIRAGTVAAQRMTVAGLRDGRELVTFSPTWYCTTELDGDDWDLRPTGWQVSVQGDTPLEVDLRFAVDLDRMAQFSPGLTAHRAVNAVPAVCAAPAGIRTTADLPQIVTALG